MIRRGCETVGIDLGTTFSALAYIDEQLTPRIVCDTAGQNVTPSVIYFDDAGIVVGDLALQHAKVAADRVARFIKPHMGDEWRAEFQGHQHSPESLSAIILRHLVQEAEPQIGPIRRAVITVPAYFTEKRRRATEHAGQIAGLDVVATLNEPMAATLAYGLYHTDEEQNVVVYDLGGGTFDVTVVHIGPNEIFELATCGNRQLGGRDWDEKLFEYVADDCRKAHDVDLRDDIQASQDLLLECECAKRALSRVSKAAIRIQVEGHRHVCEVTNEQFLKLTSSLLHSTQLTTMMALEDAGLTWNDVSRIVLVGGATHMPSVRRMLQETSGIVPDVAVNPVLAVALGAAIYGHMVDTGESQRAIHQTTGVESDDGSAQDSLPETPALANEVTVGQTDEEEEYREDASEQRTIDERSARDSDEASLPEVRFVTAHGVGVKVRKADAWQNSVVIPKNSTVPVQATKRFVTVSDNSGGSHIRIEITQGDTTEIDLAEVLAQGRIEGFPGDASLGQPVDVLMEFDQMGRLHVSATYVNTGQEVQMSLDIPGCLRPQEIEQHREHLQTARFLSVFDPDAALAGLDEQDDEEEFE